MLQTIIYTLLRRRSVPYWLGVLLHYLNWRLTAKNTDELCKLLLTTPSTFNIYNFKLQLEKPNKSNCQTILSDMIVCCVGN